MLMVLWKIKKIYFHLGFRYEDGTGGCDGCINWAGMGYSSPRAISKVVGKKPQFHGAFPKDTHRGGGIGCSGCSVEHPEF